MAIHLTDMERKAIKEARPCLAKALEKAKLLNAFMEVPPEVIDDIIYACWSGCRASMQVQSMKGEIPF